MSGTIMHPLRAAIRISSELCAMAELSNEGRISEHNAALTLQSIRRSAEAVLAFVDETEARMREGRL